MGIVYGQGNYGKVDCVYEGSRRLFYVATQFLHLYWVPLIPLRSFIVLSGTEEDDGFRGVSIPQNGRSILVAYLRAAACFGLLTGVIAGIGALGEPDFGLGAVETAGLVALGLWGLGALVGRATPRRAEELAQELGRAREPFGTLPRAQPLWELLPSPRRARPALALAQPALSPWAPMLAFSDYGAPGGPARGPAPLARRVVIRDPGSSGGGGKGGGGVGIGAVLLLVGVVLAAGAVFFFVPWGKASGSTLERSAAATERAAPAGASESQVAYEKAEAAYEAQNWQEAANQAEVACNLMLGEEASPEQRIKARRLLGSACYKLKDYEKAHEQYALLLEADPKNEEDRKAADAIYVLMVKKLDKEGQELMIQAQEWKARGSVNRAERLATEAAGCFKKAGNESAEKQAQAFAVACQTVGTDEASAQKRRESMDKYPHYDYYDYYGY